MDSCALMFLETLFLNSVKLKVTLVVSFNLLNIYFAWAFFILHPYACYILRKFNTSRSQILVRKKIIKNNKLNKTQTWILMFCRKQDTAYLPEHWFLSAIHLFYEAVLELGSGTPRKISPILHTFHWILSAKRKTKSDAKLGIKSM